MRSSSKGHYSYHLKLSIVRYGHGVASVSKKPKEMLILSNSIAAFFR